MAGRYGLAGWGGRRSNGYNGWSARGQFELTIPQDNPLGAHTPIGNYVYHADQSSQFGDTMMWQNEYLGFLANNEWFSIEQYVKLNTPDQHDGILRAWVNGRLAFETTSLRFRNTPDSNIAPGHLLNIEEVWLNVFHGGTAPSPAHEQNFYIDNVVIATEYIGPALMNEGSDTEGPTVSITAPLDGDQVSGIITISADATDNIGISGVQFLLDGSIYGDEDVSAPFSISLDTTALSLKICKWTITFYGMVKIRFTFAGEIQVR